MKTRTLHVESMTVTPQIAEAWLEKHNTKNRPLSAQHVNFLAGEMARRRWQQNGDTICFNGSVLIDGQHRLAAIVKSGVALPMLIVRNVSSEAFKTKDTGTRNRTIGDVLAIAGHGNYCVLATAAKIAMGVENGKVLDGFRPTAEDVLNYTNANPELADSCNFANKFKSQKLFPITALGACHFLFCKRSKEDADFFIEKLAIGDNLSAESPIHKLRARMIAETSSVSKGLMRQSFRIALMIKTWNAYRKKKSVGSLRWSNEESMPEIL